MKELILNIVAAILFLIGLFILVCIGHIFHKTFFEDEKNNI